jgi:hypothetical protein
MWKGACSRASYHFQKKEYSNCTFSLLYLEAGGRERAASAWSRSKFLENEKRPEQVVLLTRRFAGDVGDENRKDISCLITRRVTVAE